jgi:putative oxidoreductase
MNEYKLQIAELLLRSFTGILFLFQGYDKLFRIKMPGVVETFSADAERYHIPRLLLNSIAYYTSIAEFIGGLMLLAGFFTTYALYAIGLDLLLVSFAFTYMEPMWDMKHVFPRFVLIMALLVIPKEYQLFSLDHVLNLK